MKKKGNKKMPITYGATSLFFLKDPVPRCCHLSSNCITRNIHEQQNNYTSQINTKM